MDDALFIANLEHIFAAARSSEDGDRCAVSLAPEVL